MKFKKGDIIKSKYDYSKECLYIVRYISKNEILTLESISDNIYHKVGFTFKTAWKSRYDLYIKGNEETVNILDI